MASGGVIQAFFGDPARRRTARLNPSQLGAVGQGQPLPPVVQRKLERLVGGDLSAVRVHVGADAARLGATAFTRGDHVFFAPGKYAPHTSAGEALLAHELAHVVQQRQGRVKNPFGSGVAVVHDDRLEQEADDFARHVLMATKLGARAVQRAPVQRATQPPRQPPGQPPRQPPVQRATPKPTASRPNNMTGATVQRSSFGSGFGSGFGGGFGSGGPGKHTMTFSFGTPMSISSVSSDPTSPDKYGYPDGPINFRSKLMIDTGHNFQKESRTTQFAFGPNAHRPGWFNETYRFMYAGNGSTWATLGTLVRNRAMDFDTPYYRCETCNTFYPEQAIHIDPCDPWEEMKKQLAGTGASIADVANQFNRWDNLRLTCASCNLSKGAKAPDKAVRQEAVGRVEKELAARDRRQKLDSVKASHVFFGDDD